MKKLFFLLLFVSSFGLVNAQDTVAFPASDFTVQLEKLLCSGKNNFSEFVDKQVVINGDTTWKTKLTLPGFKYANFSRNKTMIDYAFVAYQQLGGREEANNYYQEVKKAISLSLRADCMKMEPARIPMEVRGVEQYDLWKSTKNVLYNGRQNSQLFISLSLDKENEVVVNVFLK